MAKISAEVRAAFAAIDTDGSGDIDRNELQALLRRVQPSRYFGKPAVDEALREMGADAKDRISLPAFNAWFEAGGKLTPSEKLDQRWQATSQHVSRAVVAEGGVLPSRGGGRGGRGRGRGGHLAG